LREMDQHVGPLMRVAWMTCGNLSAVDYVSARSRGCGCGYECG
jgi:hypothetical protein